MAVHLTNLHELLQQLHDALVLEDAAPVEWIVCGGTALALQNLTNRTTRDVDVLARWESTTLEVITIGSLPRRCDGRSIGWGRHTRNLVEPLPLG